MELQQLKAHEQMAADDLQRKLLNRLAGKEVDRVAVIAELQAVQTNAALQGLIELLVHKNIISANDLSAALRRGYQRATDKMESKGAGLVLPDTVIARPQ